MHVGTLMFQWTVCLSNILSTTGDLFKPVIIMLSLLTIIIQGWLSEGLSQFGPLKQNVRLFLGFLGEKLSHSLDFGAQAPHRPPTPTLLWVRGVGAAGSHFVTVRIASQGQSWLAEWDRSERMAEKPKSGRCISAFRRISVGVGGSVCWGRGELGCLVGWQSFVLYQTFIENFLIPLC